ncbi:MAG TPA: CRISPR-associated endonuclease Cas6 [Saprospiraceae bacterium]|nr:CRISPR-associated endonuclease Cas6 [Saprospiraceae bacterium]
MTTHLPISTISFPEIRLPQRAAAQLRGFFGQYFQEHSPLLHNHYEDGRLRYAYPLVQYKVLGGMPVLVGIQEGAQLLAELFFRIKTLRIGAREYPVMERDIAFRNVTAGLSDQLTDYHFCSLWMPLNQENYAEYQQKNVDEKRAMLARILTGNILSFYKGIQLFLPPEARILTTVRPEEVRLTGFKDQLMTGINGGFTTNALLPDWIGLGKSVSRGYGAIERIP